MIDQLIAICFAAALTGAAVWVVIRIFSRNQAGRAAALSAIATVLGLFVLLRRRGHGGLP